MQSRLLFLQVPSRSMEAQVRLLFVQWSLELLVANDYSPLLSSDVLRLHPSAKDWECECDDRLVRLSKIMDESVVGSYRVEANRRYVRSHSENYITTYNSGIHPSLVEHTHPSSFASFSYSSTYSLKGASVEFLRQDVYSLPLFPSSNGNPALGCSSKGRCQPTTTLQRPIFTYRFIRDFEKANCFPLPTTTTNTWTSTTKPAYPAYPPRANSTT